MKKLMKHAACLLAACLLLCAMLPISAFAAGEPYTYTVSLSMGQQGTFAGASAVHVENSAYDIRESNGRILISGLALGARVSFDQEVAALAQDSKYYVRGVRIGGRDNNTVAASSFTVGADMDLVVAYGIKGDLTQYSVNFVDEAGNELAPGRTYYGNVGDSPVVAYLYVDGYQPQSYNLTKKLSANTAENVFTFVYSRITYGGTTGEGGVIDEGTTVITLPGVATVTGGATGGAGGAGGDAGGAAGTDDTANPENGGETPESVDSSAGEVPQGAVPEEITDLDDNSTPLAGFADSASGLFAQMPIALRAVLAAACVLILVLLVLVIRKSVGRKKKDEDEKAAE